MTPEQIARFWHMVDRSDNCWLWTGATNSNGYGRFEIWRRGKRCRHLAHRLALALSGVELTPGILARHTCDNPRCVNPNHLLLGSQVDNMRDARERNRMDTTGLTLGQAATYPPRPCRDCGITVTEGRRRLCVECKTKATRDSRRRYVERVGVAA